MTHPFEQNPEATQVRVCRCGKWPDHHVHGADPCSCDVCRASGYGSAATVARDLAGGLTAGARTLADLPLWLLAIVVLDAAVLLATLR